MTHKVDVAIVGGGAAGIAAARRLAAAGRSVQLIEALPRLGGRAHSVTIQNMPLDLGCGWLHSAERNPLARLAEAEGQMLDRSGGAWRRPPPPGSGLPDEHLPEAWAAWQVFHDRLHRDPPQSDCAGDAIPRDDPWRPFIDALSSFINGTELDRLSIADFLHYEDHASDANWRLPAGYGTFITGLAANLPVALGTKVTRVAHGAGITLETDRGNIHARAAILAVSSAILAAGAIAFAPEVDDHLHAAASLPLGLADKIFLSLADPDSVPAETHLLGRPDSARTGSYYLRPFGRPIIEAYLGGCLAHDLERDGEAAAIAFAVEELSGLLGNDFARALTPLAVTAWAREPTILGSYSHALPGHAEAHALLASPISENLCLAGEACSPQDYSTAHGAWQSGLAAADWIEEGLGRSTGAGKGGIPE